MEENKEYIPTHSCNEVMRAIEKLPDDEKLVILNQFKVTDLTWLLKSPDDTEKYIEVVNDYINICIIISNAIKDLRELVMTTDDAIDTVISDYDRLDILQKKETALRLLNNSEFQKDCCEIFVKDMEKVINNSSTLKALDNLLGITKYFKECVKLGIGTNHKYEV